MLYVIIASREGKEFEEVLGVARDESAAKRICRALDCGPTLYNDARYEAKSANWTVFIDGLDEGFKIVDAEERPEWRSNRAPRKREKHAPRATKSKYEWQAGTPG